VVRIRPPGVAGFLAVSADGPPGRNKTLWIVSIVGLPGGLPPVGSCADGSRMKTAFGVLTHAPRRAVNAPN